MVHTAQCIELNRREQRFYSRLLDIGKLFLDLGFDVTAIIGIFVFNCSIGSLRPIYFCCILEHCQSAIIIKRDSTVAETLYRPPGIDLVDQIRLALPCSWST